ncbi:FtsB family cell division protein [Holzapfeliella floricola]|uniref:Septum formation initiator family protein n=1 Tax=Holzapfeliella floricola DSM 23037 = JCM 16512 TaxID=1423744 RepID=A0A0R2DJK6_9LACO|nr:septum formation initiator family protein [Holzapfeliella floricola]KRN04306.1 hypothetical protein FC86_GL000404 [Holzapfeliella floricola DSM 23037 = JCM 16512]
MGRKVKHTYQIASSEKSVFKKQRHERKVHVRRRRLYAALFGFIVLLTGMQITKMTIDTHNLNVQAEESQQKLDTLLQKQHLLSNEEQRLNDPDYLQKVVRDKYLYSKPNEVIFDISDNSQSK